MEITITIPDEKKNEVIDAFATQYNYPTKVQNEEGVEIDNPITKGQFALNIVNSFIKEVYVAGQLKPLEEEKAIARDTAIQEIDVITVE